MDCREFITFGVGLTGSGRGQGSGTNPPRWKDGLQRMHHLWSRINRVGGVGGWGERVGLFLSGSCMINSQSITSNIVD